MRVGQTFERTRDVWLAVSEPEEADDDEEVDDLAGVAFNVEDEGVRNLRQKGQPGCKVTGRRERHSHLAGERG